MEYKLTRREKEYIKQGLSLPLRYHERERMKNESWKIIGNINYNILEQIEGAKQLIFSHFNRSLEVSINQGYWRVHPTFDDYIRMTDYSDILPKDIYNKIRQDYGIIEGEIEKGYTYWFPLKIRKRMQ